MLVMAPVVVARAHLLLLQMPAAEGGLLAMVCTVQPLLQVRC